MLMDMGLPEFDIYQSTAAPNCFNPILGVGVQICTPINYFQTFTKMLTAMNLLTFSLYPFSSIVPILVVIANILADLW